jgi:hypothetical protein
MLPIIRSTICLCLAPFVMSHTIHGAGESSQQVGFHWDFRAGGGALESWQGLWVLESKAAKAEGAFRLEPQPGNKPGVADAFILEDVYDSSVLGEPDVDGTPIISTTFESIEKGVLSFAAGTSGTQNQNAMVTLLANGRPVLIIKLINNTKGVVVSGSGESNFSDEAGWFNRTRQYVVTWDGSSAAIAIRSDDGDVLPSKPIRFLAPGSPDQIRLQVGYGRGTTKSLRLEEFSLYSNKLNKTINRK